MGNVRFAIYVTAPFGLNYYAPQYNLANTANHTWEGSELLTQTAVKQAIEITTDMLVDAPFTDLIMGYFGLANTDTSSPWYQHDTPVITWNGVPVSPMTTPPDWKHPDQKWGLLPNVGEYLQKIAASGKNLVASMQHDADLAYIQNNWTTEGFYEAFDAQVLTPFHLTGLDLDMESQWSTYPNVLIELSNTFGKEGRLVSHAPYGYLDCSSGFETMLAYYLCPEQSAPQTTPLVGHTVIENGAGERQNSISWLNIQYYSGGEQGSASAVLQQYITAVSATAAIPNSGIAEPAYFCLAGFSPCICDPDFRLWIQPRDATAQQNCCTKPGTVQTDNCTSGTLVLDAVNDLVQHYGKDASGRAQFGGVFIYDYRYYTPDQDGYSYQMETWNMIASALGL
ncbi:MAG: hypothetical protein AAF441_00050 [Pseudomonadota bacterium]